MGSTLETADQMICLHSRPKEQNPGEQQEQVHYRSDNPPHWFPPDCIQHDLQWESSKSVKLPILGGLGPTTLDAWIQAVP